MAKCKDCGFCEHCGRIDTPPGGQFFPEWNKRSTECLHRDDFPEVCGCRRGMCTGHNEELKDG